MNEYFNSVLNSKVKLGYLHPVCIQGKSFISTCEQNTLTESSLNDFADVLSHLTSSLKNNDICRDMDNNRDFLSLVTTFENDLNDKVHKLRDIKSNSDHQSVIDTCKTIMKAWLQLILLWEKVQTKEINTLASKVKECIVTVLNTNSSEHLVKNFQNLCSTILTFKESVSVYANQLFDSNSGKLLLLFENIARLLSSLSKTAELKFKFQGLKDDDKYLKCGKFCCESILFFVSEVTLVFKIPCNLSNPSDENQATSESVPCFVDLIDEIQDEVTIRRKNPDVEKLSKNLIALHWFCFKLVPLCSKVLHQRIMESMERLLDLQEEIVKSIDCSEHILDELETMEKLVNMAILRILLDFAVNCHKEENKIMKNVINVVKENQSGNLEQFQAEFQSRFQNLREMIEKLCLVIEIILNCCTFNTAKWWISVCSKRLLFVNESLISCLEDYVKDPNNVATIHQLNLVKKEWDTILKLTFNNVFTITDTSEMLKLIDANVKAVLGEMEDELNDQTDMVQWKSHTQKVTTFAKITLRVVEAFSMTKLGLNGKKALKLASNQVICSIKSVNLFQNTFVDDPKNEDVKKKMLLFLNNLEKEIEKLVSLCNDVKSSDLYNTSTESELDDETKTEFGISDILNELTIDEMVEKNSFSSMLEFVCSVISQKDVNDSESKIFSSLSLDFMREMSKLSTSELFKKQKKLMVQAKELLSELDRFSGSPLLLEISKDTCAYTLQVLSHSDESETVDTKVLTKNLKRGICEITNMKVLVELSSLLRRLEMLTNEIEHTKVDPKTSCDTSSVISRTTNLFKQLITLIETAENTKILVHNQSNGKNLKRSFRSLGFNSTVGIFSEDI